MRWLVLALLLTACSLPATSPSSAPTVGRTLPATASPSPSPSATCQAGDQAQYVYNPTRLKVLSPCIHVTGTVAARRAEADGDYHILLKLDPPYLHYLTPANQGVELGDLVVEPVCEHSITQADAQKPCAGDTDPVLPLPSVGMHIWAEGQYVLDLDHGSWAEIHPLGAWEVTP